jgi:hypothetical protein
MDGLDGFTLPTMPKRRTAMRSIILSAVAALALGSAASAQTPAAPSADPAAETCATLAAKYEVAKEERKRSPNLIQAKAAAAAAQSKCAKGQEVGGVAAYKDALRLLGR